MRNDGLEFMLFQKKIRFSMLLLASLFGGVIIPHKLFAANTCPSSEYIGFIPCGQNCDNPSTPNDEAAVCTLCHLFLVLQNITRWMLHTMTYIALAIISAMGILYVVSMNNARLSDMAGRGIWAALIGFAITLLGWVIINGILMVIADGTLGTGTASFSIKTNGPWFEFNCSTETKYVATTGSDNTSTTESATGKSCSFYSLPTTTAPAGYGSPFNQLSNAKEPTLDITCSASSATATAGSSQNNTYVYKTGFVSQGGTWSEVNFSGTAAPDNTGWLTGTATTDLPVTSSTSGPNFVIAFICQYIDNTWKCGCRDSVCIQNYWTLQAYIN